jgi:heme exporter protein A
MKLNVTNLTKEYDRRPVFRDISFSLEKCDSLAITGRNGSGKSTLIKILVGVLSPTKGSVTIMVDGSVLSPASARDQIGVVSPHLQMYEEFSAIENLRILSRIRALRRYSEEESGELLRQFNLWEKRNEHVRTYSSGMRQRLKFVFALLHRPALLLLDEPTANLDVDGIRVVRQVVKNQKKSGILIVATNSSAEARWCRGRIHLGP